jgi:hypothetical protein
MKLSDRARRAMDELWAVRAECDKAVTELAVYAFRDPREEEFRRAAGLYEEAGEMIARSLDDFMGMTTLLAAEEAEREADATEMGFYA